MDNITLAILAKDKEYCLDFYLTCILNQTYDKKKIHLYIKTNDNRDNTEKILDKFVKTHGKKYASVYYNTDSISNSLKMFGEHEWNPARFNILGKIRQESIDYAIEKNTHYFVADCDNFITKDTLEHFYNLRHLKFVGPMLPLSPVHNYANYHNIACNAGYYEENEAYYPILLKQIKGLIEVDTLHCTYFINNNILDEITYDDDTDRYEYAILSNRLRQKNITQYLDNSKFHGFLFLTDEIKIPFDDYIEKHWHKEFKLMNNTAGYYDFVEIGTCDFETIIQTKNPGKGISIEPLPHYFNNLPDVDDVAKLNVAISDQDGKMDIYWVPPKKIKEHNLPWWVAGSNRIGEPNPFVINLLKEKGLTESINDIVEIKKVKVKSWQTLAKEFNIQHASIIKIDTEGHEQAILKNMHEDLLKRPQFRPTKICFEHSTLTDGPYMDSIINLFEKLNYVFKRVSGTDSTLTLQK